jgi:hypothetical protein
VLLGKGQEPGSDQEGMRSSTRERRGVGRWLGIRLELEGGGSGWRLPWAVT